MPTMLNVTERNQVVTEQKTLLPLTQIFEDIKVKPTSNHLIISPSSTKSIQDIFPEQEYEEKNTQKAKEVLGELANNFSKEELRDLTAQVEYLAETWLDDFERDIFKGRTLNELLHERGGV